MAENKERNLLAGFEFASVTGGIAAFFMMVLSLFTVTVEVFIRKDMGQRYFNAINFYAGIIVFGTLSFIINLFSSLSSTFGQGNTGGFSWLIFIVWLAYVVMGVFHFLRQWYREESGKPVHSLYAGTPRLEPLGRILMKLVNAILEIPVRIFASTLSREEREDLPKVLPVFKDSFAFTYRFVEPFFLYVLGIIVSVAFSYLVGMWLLLSSVAVLFYMNVGLEKERHEALNIRDKMLEATEMKAAMEGTSEFMRVPHSTKRVMENIAQKVEDSPVLMENVRTFNPTIAEAMEALNPSLKSISSE